MSETQERVTLTDQQMESIKDAIDNAPENQAVYLGCTQTIREVFGADAFTDAFDREEKIDVTSRAIPTRQWQQISGWILDKGGPLTAMTWVNYSPSSFDDGGPEPEPIPSQPSAPFAIQVNEGVGDVIRDCMDKIYEAQNSRWDATTETELHQRDQKLAEMKDSLLNKLAQMFFVHHKTEGDLNLFRDSDLSLFWRYDSGYCGAHIYHKSDDTFGSWSTHT